MGAVIERLCIFAYHGIPEMVVTDNSPQFSCTEFDKFTHNYDDDYFKIHAEATNKG